MIDKDKFKSKTHEKRFKELINKFKININDDRREAAMFFIIAGKEKLFKKAEDIYIKKKNILKDLTNFTDEEEKMLRVALDICEIYPIEPKENIISIMNFLKDDEDNRLIIYALELAFIYD